MEIKRLTEQNFDAAIKLSEYAFLYRLSEQQKEDRRARFGDEAFWGIFENDELSAKLSLIPLDVYIHGKIVKMGGIAGVATWPEKRRRGMVSLLLRRALEEMKAEGQLLSYLHPFSIAFYRKYGWELFTDNKNYRVSVDKLPARKNVPGRVVRDIREIDVLKSIYDRAIVRYNGSIARSRSWWENRVMNGVSYTAVYYNESGEAEAYVLYAIENKVWMTEEIFWLNETARQGLWDFIVNHDSKLTEVQLKMPADDPLAMLLPDPMVKQELEPYFMGRIVDAPAFIQVYPFVKSGSDSHFIVHIEDRDAPWNEGKWSWTITANGEARLEPLQSSGDQEFPADLTLVTVPSVFVPTGILTSMLLGYRRPSDLQRCGLLATSETTAAELDARIPARTPYLPDYF